MSWANSRIPPLAVDEPETGARSPPAAQRQAVGVVGIGHMSEAFALNLIADGFRVLAYNPYPERLEPIRLAGGEAAPDLSSLAECDVALTSVCDDDTLEAVAQGLLASLRPGAVHLSMSTVSPGMSRALAAEHEARGQRYVAAPVLGNADRARARGLFIVAGGRPAATARVRPLLERLGQRLFVVGDDPGEANLIQLAGNALAAAALQSLAEVLALLRKSGMDERFAFDVLTNSLFDSEVHKTYGGKMIDGRHRPAGMATQLAVRDLRLALAEAERMSVPMPTASLVRDRLVGLVAVGGAKLDWSALGLLAARDADLAPSFGAPTLRASRSALGLAISTPNGFA